MGNPTNNVQTFDPDLSTFTKPETFQATEIDYNRLSSPQIVAAVEALNRGQTLEEIEKQFRQDGYNVTLT